LSEWLTTLRFEAALSYAPTHRESLAALHQRRQHQCTTLYATDAFESSGEAPQYTWKASMFLRDRWQYQCTTTNAANAFESLRRSAAIHMEGVHISSRSTAAFLTCRDERHFSGKPSDVTLVSPLHIQALWRRNISDRPSLRPCTRSERPGATMTREDDSIGNMWERDRVILAG
jgi:hypothetical protein